MSEQAASMAPGTQVVSRLEGYGPLMAWGSLALAVMIAGATIAIASSTPHASLPAPEPDGGLDLAFGLVYLAFSTVGALVASRRPGNAIGWLFVAFGLVGMAIGLAGAWALHSLYVEDSALPAGKAAAWIGAWIGWFLGAPLVLMLLLFPDGRLPGARWRVVAWLSLVAPALSAIGAGLASGPLENLESVSNPVAIEGATGVLGAVKGVGLALALGLLIAAAMSLVLRFRRSNAQERQQIKWFAAGAVFAAVLFGGVLATTLSPSLHESDSVTEVTDVLVALAFTALPLTAGIAILRHRLWDIDVVINARSSTRP